MRFALFVAKNAGHEQLLISEMEKAFFNNMRGDLWEK